MPETKCGFETIPGGASGSDLLVAYGPTLKVDIGFDPAYSHKNIGQIPIHGLRGISALVDTGATESCIDSRLASQLNLPIVDRRQISGAHGSGEVNIHLAQVHVVALNSTIYGAFAAVHLSAGGQPHSALIGRTFLKGYKMLYDGQTGSVIISSN